MHRPHMSGREHRQLQTQAMGVCRRLITYQVYHYSQRWGTGSRFGIWVRRGCRVFRPPPGRVPKRSPDTQGLLCPALGAVHQHLRAPGCPQAATTRDPLPSPPPWMRHASPPRPECTLAQCHPLAYLLAADPSPGPLSVPAALASAFSSVYVPALRRCVSRVRVNPGRGASAVDVRRRVRPELRRGDGAGASENRAHAPRGGPLPPPSALRV